MATSVTPAERMTSALRYLQQRCIPAGYSLEFATVYDPSMLRHRVTYVVADHRGNSIRRAVLIDESERLTDASPVFNHIVESVEWLMALDNDWRKP